MIGSALGLLLVFRTNTAYNRFWEGRKIWEKILSSLRDLGRMTVLYGDVIEPSRVERILHLLCVFPLGDIRSLLFFLHNSGRCCCYYEGQYLLKLFDVLFTASILPYL